MTARLLFSDNRLDVGLQGQIAAVVKEVEAALEVHLHQIDEAAWAAALARRYAVEKLVLRRDEMFQEPVAETQIDVSHDRSRDICDRNVPFHIKGFRARVHVPFTGERDVLFLRPQQFTLNPPRALVEQGAIVIVIDYLPTEQVDIRGRCDQVLDSIEQWLDFGREQISELNDRLEVEALAAIRRRREHLEEGRRRVEESGIPVRSPNDGRRAIPDVIVRRPSPLPARTAGGQPLPLDPSLRGEIYEDVLSILRQAGNEFERRPAAYAGLGEEELRHHLLTPLNVSYRGQTVAEAFNQRGKTDILLRFEGRNLFIAECKFWSGPKGFLATIDQLFRYVAWRDTKLAIVMFVRARDLSAVLEAARDTLPEHPEFVREGRSEEEAEIRARMTWPGDRSREVDLSVLFVHLLEH